MNPLLILGGGVGAAALAAYLFHVLEGSDSAPASGSDPDYPDSGDTDSEDNAPAAEDVEGLSRALASEADEGSYTHDERVGIGCCAVNVAARRKKSIASIMLPKHHQPGHWCSTWQDPTDADRQLARSIIAGDYGDTTKGSYSFFEPAEQDREYNTGKVTHDAQGIRDKWTGPPDNMQLLATIGRWEFYGK